jgi:hypothetical protein
MSCSLAPDDPDFICTRKNVIAHHRAAPRSREQANLRPHTDALKSAGDARKKGPRWAPDWRLAAVAGWRRSADGPAQISNAIAEKKVYSTHEWANGSPTLWMER